MDELVGGTLRVLLGADHEEDAPSQDQDEARTAAEAEERAHNHHLDNDQSQAHLEEMRCRAVALSHSMGLEDPVHSDDEPAEPEQVQQLVNQVVHIESHGTWSSERVSSLSLEPNDSD